jgi:PiT family inorganic phosphate transporter
MPSGIVWLVIVVLVALLFDYINGFHDTANAIATSVSTKALTPQRAVMLAAVLNFIGALSGTAVAGTIGKGIVAPQDITQEVVVASLIGAICWNIITWLSGIPSSSSHALIGGSGPSGASEPFPSPVVGRGTAAGSGSESSSQKPRTALMR